MASSHKKRTGLRAALIVLLCLVLVCAVAAAVLYSLVSRKVKAFQSGASFALDYAITSTEAEPPALYALLSGTTANKLRDMMNYNVSAHYGTNRFPGLNLCAKTGTAEVGDGTSHAWFTGFLLDDAHPYAFVVLVENAGGGLTNAGAVANTVLQAAVNK